MKRVRCYTIIALLAFCSSSALAETSGDSRALSEDEVKTFLPLLCGKPAKKDEGYHCTSLIAYPYSQFGVSSAGGASISLDAIAFGAFTNASARQAYVSYSSSAGSIATGAGGGALFEQDRTRWKLVRWFPGGQMDHCLALPSDGKQTMLCLLGSMREDQRMTSSIGVRSVPQSGDPKAALVDTFILKAEDARGIGEGNLQCSGKRKKDEAVLLAVKSLAVSKVPGYFAEAALTYATPENIAKACLKKNFSNVLETSGTAYFALKGGSIEFALPEKFAASER